eukprot:TRINITY_DN224_c0_g2_i1.p1 TRINITY_DN224_c0_g2~~TRINITY_DN224_c0_g2_i1.p1  ORF type:complete len:519 (+),score=76.19 TRINITY_DN224_c0_g2_i1:190-1557(+)
MRVKDAGRRKYRYSHHTREMRGDELQSYRRGEDNAGPQGRLRVGYITGDIGDHPLATCMQDVFLFHDEHRFNITVYSLGPDNDSPIRQRIKERAEAFVDLYQVKSDAEAASRIHHDALDILIDLSGHTKEGRMGILAFRPAPLQVELMGYTATTGVPQMSYYIGDPTATPVVTAGTDFVEPLAYLPHSYFVTHHRQHHADVLDDDDDDDDDAEQYGLPAKWDTMFCSFNRLIKIDRQVLTMWSRILSRTPASYLWLLDFPSHAVRGLREQARGLGMEGRLIFTPRFPLSIHLKVKRHCDIHLDTLSWNAHTTAADALWSGIPIITWPRRRMASRVTASLLAALLRLGPGGGGHTASVQDVSPEQEGVGVGEGDQGIAAVEVWRRLVAESEEGYVERAVTLARQPALRRQVRQTLRRGRVEGWTFNTGQWTHDWENLIQSMWTVTVELGMKGYNVF